MAEHLLDASEVGSPFQQMRRERMAKEVGVDAGRVQPGFPREPAQDEEGARARERAALRVEEELGAVPVIEMGSAPSQVAA
jgi:hypothetical protein